jgi:DNA polymerase-3 subunit alpha
MVKDGDFITVAGLITGKKRKFTKNNAEMAYVTLEDLTADIEIIVFPKVLQLYDNELEEDQIVAISGRIDAKEDEPPKLLADNVRKLDPNNSGRLFIKIPKGKENKLREILDILKIFSGNTPVILYYENTKQYIKVPNEYWSVHNNPILNKQVYALLGEDCEIKYMPIKK